MDTLINKHDALEQLIYDEGIRIKTVDVHADMDMLLIVLNTGYVLKQKLSGSSLGSASDASLQKYELIGQGTGVHWPDLDEDLSLKGLLSEAIRVQITGDKVA